MAVYHCPCCPIDHTHSFPTLRSISLSPSLRNRERENLSLQDHNPTVQNESHSYAKLPDALEQTTHSLTKPQQLTTSFTTLRSLSLSLSLRRPKLSVPAASNFASSHSQLSSGRFAYVVESVQMETKRPTSTSIGGAAVVQLAEATFGQLLLLTCAWDALLANLLTASALLSFAQDPFVLSTCGQKSHGDNESEHSNSKAVDGDEDGDEEKNNDGGLGDTDEEPSSEDGGGAGNNPNGKSNNSKARPEGEDGEVGEDGEEEEEDGNNRDDNDDDGEDDGDEDNEDDEDDEDDDEGEVKDEEEIVDEEEPEDDEEEDEEDALQPPKKRKK